MVIAHKLINTFNIIYGLVQSFLIVKIGKCIRTD